jgi:thymidine kinase
MCGTLEIILGPMYSGKSSTLISIVNRYNAIKKKIIVVNHSLDKKRNDTMCIRTHDKTTIPAIFLENINELSNRSDYQSSEIVIIEESQFFKGLYDFISNEVDNLNKRFILIGLSGGYKRQKLGELLDLIPMAEKVTKLDALCVKCNDGSLACFSHRTADKEGELTESDLVGGAGDYIAVCRYHYLLLNRDLTEEEEEEYSFNY